MKIISFWFKCHWNSHGSNSQYASIDSDNGLGPNRWQAIIWANDGLVYWQLYESLCLSAFWQLPCWHFNHCRVQTCWTVINYGDKKKLVCLLWGAFQRWVWALNLTALKISMLYKNHIFQCMGKLFFVEFQRVTLKFHIKYLTPYIERCGFYSQVEI